MKNIVIALMVIITLFISNCSKNPITVMTSMDIAYKDKLGNDLLDSSTQNHYSTDSIHVYNVVNGIKKERYYGNLDNPRLWSIFKIDSLNTYFLGIGLEVDTTLLELNKRTTDTLTCIIDKSNGNRILRKFWYNGVLKWDNVLYPQEITIIK